MNNNTDVNLNDEQKTCNYNIENEVNNLQDIPYQLLDLSDISDIDLNEVNNENILDISEEVEEDDEMKQMRYDENMAKNLQREYDQENHILTNMNDRLETTGIIGNTFINTAITALNLLNGQSVINTNQRANQQEIESIGGRNRRNNRMQTDVSNRRLNRNNDNSLSTILQTIMGYGVNNQTTERSFVQPYNAENTSFFTLVNDLLTSLNTDNIDHQSIPIVLNKEEVNQIGIIKSKDNIEHKDEVCVICLCKFEDNDNIRLLPCNHNFHVVCIDKWLIEYNYKCPVCRKEVGRGHPIL